MILAAIKILKLRTFVLISIGLLFSHFSIASSIEVDRDGSKLTASWPMSGPGTWTLQTSRGESCASGRIQIGQTRLVLEKVAADTNLVFSIDTNFENDSISVPAQDNLSPLSKPRNSSIIYQLPVRTWLATGKQEYQAGKFNYLSTRILRKIKTLGVDYIWLTGVPDYSSIGQVDPDVVKGNAGSYYAVHDNWDVESSLGSLNEFQSLIDRIHATGMRVLIDIVPNHTARIHKTDIVCKSHYDFGARDRTDRFFDTRNNYFYLQNSTFTPPFQQGKPGVDGVFDQDLSESGIQWESPARVTGNDIASANPSHGDWFETAKLNYGYNFQNKEEQYDPMPATWKVMTDVGKYWLKLGVDGFRLDYAHAVPLQFWRYFSRKLKEVQPNVFLIAEAYELDERMRVPGFSYQALLEAGFDSVYNSNLYWGLRSKANPPRGNRFSSRPSFQDISAKKIKSVGNKSSLIEGYFVTNYLENHDEVRLASRFFAEGRLSTSERGKLGYNYSAYAALMPANFLIHGGQELQEEADIYGPFAGDNGRTSIFDFVYQRKVLEWIRGEVSHDADALRENYQRLFALKRTQPFNQIHSHSLNTYLDLTSVNYYSPNSEWISSYIRFSGQEVYLVVSNSDPYNPRSASIHFTNQSGEDTIGALFKMGIGNSENWYEFTEVLNRQGLKPRDPQFDRPGSPGWALFKSGGIPSGFHIGNLRPGETLVFKMQRVN